MNNKTNGTGIMEKVRAVYARWKDNIVYIIVMFLVV